MIDLDEVVHILGCSMLGCFADFQTMIRTKTAPDLQS
jgi:hypothetical protein